MRELKEGESYTGDELVDILGDSGERLFAYGNNEVRVIVEDEGNDNYKLLHIVEVKEVIK